MKILCELNNKEARQLSSFFVAYIFFHLFFFENYNNKKDIKLLENNYFHERKTIACYSLLHNEYIFEENDAVQTTKGGVADG